MHDATAVVITDTIPAGMDLSPIEAGDTVLIKAIAGEDGAWIARSIKQVGFGGEDEDEIEIEDDDLEGFRDHSAFCDEGKQDRPHPLATAIADRYEGVNEEMVMGYYCDGYSIGAIMLAVKTSQLEGVTDSIADLLGDRAEGKGWGLIWQDLGLIGSEKEGHSPSGLLKQPPHAGPKK